MFVFIKKLKSKNFFLAYIAGISESTVPAISKHPVDKKKAAPAEPASSGFYVPLEKYLMSVHRVRT